LVKQIADEAMIIFYKITKWFLVTLNTMIVLIRTKQKYIEMGKRIFSSSSMYDITKNNLHML